MAKQIMRSLVLLTVLSATVQQAYGLQCVACSSTDSIYCLSSPDDGFPVLDCTKCVNYGKFSKADGSLMELTRDCANRIFPTPFPKEYENSCKTDAQDYVECTHTCTNEDFCSNDLSYFPPGWDEEKVIGTGTTEVADAADDGKSTCVVCYGTPGTDCHEHPEKIAHTLRCDKCAIFASIYKNGNTLKDVQRDCYNRIFPNPIPFEYENKCKDDNSQFIECTHTCKGDLCSNDLSLKPPGWNSGSHIAASSFFILISLMGLVF